MKTYFLRTVTATMLTATMLTATVPATFSTVMFSQNRAVENVYYQKKDVEIFNKYLSFIQENPVAGLTTGELISRTAGFFLGVPYVAHTLEIEPEGLVVNLREMDCTTYLETVYALAMTVRSGELSFENFCNKLRLLRYREGVINDYTDRLHYTSGWIGTNIKKGLVCTVTDKSNSEPIQFTLNIMSSNTGRYKQLKGKPELIDRVKKREKELSSYIHYYLPTDKIERNKNIFNSGDMLGFVTTQPGIDISHVGIICVDGDKLTFYHASSTHKKVVLSELSIVDYLRRNPKNIGIISVRAAF